jgi:hypothetical protein
MYRILGNRKDESMGGKIFCSEGKLKGLDCFSSVVLDDSEMLYQILKGSHRPTTKHSE